MTRKRRASPRPPAEPPDEAGEIRAFVLVQVVPGRLEGIARALRRMPAVRTVDPVTGPYDLVALVAVRHPRELSSLIAGTIGGLRGVSRTTTLICAN